jgi:hypothetical protein
MTRARLRCALGLWLATWTLAGSVAAQARDTGQHPYYGVELEPHAEWQWSGDEWSWENGFGFGARASIPLLEDGPVQSLNNSLAVTFGFDWAYFANDCSIGGMEVDCHESDIWIPIAAQWNFFVSERFSLFPEFGVGFRTATRSTNYCAASECDDSSLEVHAVLWFGARFLVTDRVAVVLRLGTPSLTLGASFLL